MLSQQAIEEYRQIYKEQFGKEISHDEALRQGIKLLRLFKAIYKPIPINHFCTDKYRHKKTIKGDHNYGKGC